jgi:hypothetical protein
MLSFSHLPFKEKRKQIGLSFWLLQPQTNERRVREEREKEEMRKERMKEEMREGEEGQKRKMRERRR